MKMPKLLRKKDEILDFLTNQRLHTTTAHGRRRTDPELLIKTEEAQREIAINRPRLTTQSLTVCNIGSSDLALLIVNALIDQGFISEINEITSEAASHLVSEVITENGVDVEL